MSRTLVELMKVMILGLEVAQRFIAERVLRTLAGLRVSSALNFSDFTTE